MDKPTPYPMPAEFPLLIQAGESQRLEFKEKVTPAFAKEYAAFANADGGKIIVGVTDSGRVTGIKDSNHTRAQIQDIARNCDPAIAVSVSSLNIDDKTVLEIAVPEGARKPYSCSNGFYLRVGASSQKMKRDELLEFIQKVQPFCFDEQACRTFRYPKDFDKEAFRLFLSRSDIDNAGLKDEDVLCNLGVATKYRRKLIFNNAGVLFFARDPKRFVRHVGTTCLLLAGTDKTEILDRKDSEGNLARNAHQVMAFLKRHLSVRYKIEKLKREEILEVPEAALREAVLNALTHRDYTQKGTAGMVEIYQDRVEITNPGGLPPGLKKSDLGKRSVHRNPIIADLFHRMGEVEKVGSGIGRIRRAAKAAHLPQPTFEANDFFTVTFSKPPGEDVTQETAQVPHKYPASTMEVPCKYHGSTAQVPRKYRASTAQVLECCREPRNRLEIQGYLGLKHREAVRKGYLIPLLRQGLLAMTIPDKPRSSKQRYVTTSKGLKRLKRTCK